jgi:lactate dehydrogenase-like 2-hydroxyacid dehydrogenase
MYTTYPHTHTHTHTTHTQAYARTHTHTHTHTHRKLGTPVGGTIHGKRLLVVGYGALGKETVNLLRAFQPGSVGVFRHGAWDDAELLSVDDAVSCVLV